MVSRGAQGRAESRSSSSRRGAGDSSSRRTSASSATSEEEQTVVVAAPPSPRCVKRRDFKAQGRARSRAKNLRRMEGGGGLGANLVAGGSTGVIGEEVGGKGQCRTGRLGGEEGYHGRVGVEEQPFILMEAYTVGRRRQTRWVKRRETQWGTRPGTVPENPTSGTCPSIQRPAPRYVALCHIFSRPGRSQGLLFKYCHISFNLLGDTS